MSDHTSAIAWLEWSADAFARAKAEQKPVLLAIGATWCHWCHEMDRTSYADPVVTSIVNERFVPVRVDADRRPDISDRYSLGGWPTTVFLTPEGEILGGGTYVSRETMPGILAQVAEAFATRGQEIAVSAARLAEDRAAAVKRDAGVAEADWPAIADRILEHVLEQVDETYGGFGIEPKFPHADALTLVLARAIETGDERLRAVAKRALDAMGWGGLYDEAEGGFFRYATTRDWSLPHTEKLLDVNAALLRVYVEAWAAFGDPRYEERARGVLAYVNTSLADHAAGGFFGSQEANDDYYRARADGRRLFKPPPVDRCLYSDWNALMVSAWLRASELFRDEPLGRFAIQSLERVTLGSYRPGHGVAHYLEPSTTRSFAVSPSKGDEEPHVRGLLTDQIAMADALLDAHEATGLIPYEMMAEELMHYALRVLWDARDGGFYDRAIVDDAEVGLLCERVKPFVANCHAARVLFRVASVSGEEDFRTRAIEAVASQMGEWERHGMAAAALALAVPRAID